MAQDWVVRIVVFDATESTAASVRTGRDKLWLGELLRYAGHVSTVPRLSRQEGAEVFDLRCPNPKDHDTKVWAEQNAARIASFGLNAAAAPAWTDTPYAEQEALAKAARAQSPGSPSKTRARS